MKMQIFCIDGKCKKNLLFGRFKQLTQDELDNSDKNKASKIVQKVLEVDLEYLV